MLMQVQRPAELEYPNVVATSSTASEDAYKLWAYLNLHKDRNIPVSFRVRHHPHVYVALEVKVESQSFKQKNAGNLVLIKRYPDGQVVPDEKGQAVTVSVSVCVGVRCQ
jgi:hypothetical protein